MTGHVRTASYLVAATAIWFAEDGVFSYAFRFDAAQVVVVSVYFAILLATALGLAARTYRRARADGSDLPIARLAPMAPVLVVLVGSFAALPIFMVVLVLGSVI